MTKIRLVSTIIKQRLLLNKAQRGDYKPPRFKYNRDDIINAALELVREKGADGLTARALAARLGSSSKPMFTLFNGMDEVRACVISAADKLYNSYIDSDMARSE